MGLLVVSVVVPFFITEESMPEQRIQKYLEASIYSAPTKKSKVLIRDAIY